MRASAHALLALLAAICALALNAAFATAQGGPSGVDEAIVTLEESEQYDSVPDTDATPKHQSAEGLWTQVAGARYPRPGRDGATLVEGSGTTFDVDLFDVAFEHERHGFAVGAECAGLAPRGENESDVAYAARVDACTRVPVIYEFDHPEAGNATWRRVYVGEGRGYAGSIAWLPDGRAMAVGGTGEYPRREARREDTDSDETWTANDPAGKGRAWLYADGAWSEIDLSPQHATGIRGMTALDFHPGDNPKLGFAGALGQIWRIEDGRFGTEPIKESLQITGGRPVPAAPPHVPSTNPIVHQPVLVGRRVREIRFVPTQTPMAFLVTAGCCTGNPVSDRPNVGRYDGLTGEWVPAFYMLTGATTEDKANTPETPDSLYGLFLARNLTTSSGGKPFWISLLATPGGPRRDAERGSIITAPQRSTGDRGTGPCNVTWLARLPLTRLVAADNDSTAVWGVPNTWAGVRPTEDPHRRCAEGRDLVPGWAVGELRARRGPLGAPGLAVATHLRPEFKPDTVNVEDQTNGPPVSWGVRPTQAELTSGQWEATNEERIKKYLASSSYSVGSYALNGIDVIGDSGTGWAVGDRGSILLLDERRLAGQKRAAGPPAPVLGEPVPARLPDTAPFDSFRPQPSGSAGRVPVLATQPVQELREPRLIPMGSPDPTRNSEGFVDAPGEDVRQIVMSRDGSEGWAIGPTTTGGFGLVMSLYHYDGSRWRRCDAEGIRAELDPDPACASLASLRAFTASDNRSLQRASLIAAARVPYENDGDAGNDDEFEVVAIGTQYRERTETWAPIILRYRDGRWRHEHPAARKEVWYDSASSTNLSPPIGIAFGAPDDGWILARPSARPHHSGKYPLFHFNGTEWVDCEAQAPRGCDDPDGRTLLRTGGVDTSSLPGSGVVLRGITSAGKRVFLYGHRFTGGGQRYPLILHHDAGGKWRVDAGGLDPGCVSVAQNACVASGKREEQGEVIEMAVAAGDAGYTGWALGRFGPYAGVVGYVPGDLADTSLMRLQPGAPWERFYDSGAAADYLDPPVESSTTGVRANQAATGAGDFRHAMLTLAARGDDGSALIAPRSTGRLFAFDGKRFRLVPPERPVGAVSPNEMGVDGWIQAVAPDGAGGAWVAVKNVGPSGSAFGQVHFFHYTSKPRQPVFDELPHPIRRRVTALAAGRDGSVWMGSTDGQVSRYDRITGWSQMRIPGWDPGRVVTRPSQVLALAVDENGSGYAVGEGGRIARIGPTGVILDAAAGRLCDLSAIAPPCSTGRNLRAVATLSDGSAMAGGDALALLWRPPGTEEGFRAIERPAAGVATTITGIALPTPDTAYLTTDTGIVFAGERDETSWSWRKENLRPDGKTLGRDLTGAPLPLRAIAVDAEGHGFAVGDRGLVLKRTPGSRTPWTRVKTRFLDDLTVATLPPDGGPGAVIGGEHGVIYTETSAGFDLVRPADYFAEFYSGRPAIESTLTGDVVGLAIVPGARDGSVEAWAALQSPVALFGDEQGADRLLHYASDPGDPLIDPQSRVRPLPDAPAPREGELSFAAFGKSECHDAPSIGDDSFCQMMEGSTNTYEVMARRIANEVADQQSRPGGPRFALFTGDAVDSTGYPTRSTTQPVVKHSDMGFVRQPEAYYRGHLKHKRWLEFVVDPVERAGLPVFGALGRQDLADAQGARQVVEAGDNLAWRQAMGSRPAPWGTGRAAETDQYEFVEAAHRGVSVTGPNPELDDPDGAEGPAKRTKLDVGAGARTHYAVDVVPKGGGDPVARIVVVDTSKRSLAASDPHQRPVEPAGGQLAWVEQMICLAPGRTPAGDPCTRREGQAAIVVSNTPTYSYGPGALTHTQTDGTEFERKLLEHKATVVVSGRLGWNGRYWATAPGIHEPCPGGSYQEETPEPGTRVCGRGVEGEGPGRTVSAALRGLAAPEPPRAADLPGGASGLDGILPVVVASGAGGKFGPDGDAQPDASQGYWHGYTVVRVPADGDPRAVIVEQRPVYDWISLTASTNVVRPGQRLTLRGTARAPIGSRYPNNGLDVRYDRIDSAAITHRYDLIEADPAKPWLPRVVEGNGNPHGYAPLDPQVATVDPQSGKVVAGRGNKGRVYALALLSLGRHAAAVPLVFEPRRSFTPPAPRKITVPPAVPPVRVLGLAAQAVPSQPPPAPPATPPIAVDLVLPPPPAIPGLPGGTPTPIAPPVPPVSPPPPPSQGQVATGLAANPLAILLAPTAAPIPPSSPLIQPAPPSGARREARQKQAATAKSEEGATERAREGAGDLADGPMPPTAAQMVRRERARSAAGSVSALRNREQPSAWATGLQLGGGTALMALVLSLGYTTLRPTPRGRRRDDVTPAPAWARRRRW